MITKEDSVATGTCITVEVESVPILTYQNILTPHLSNLLINLDEDVEWGLRNTNDAVYGKVLSGGIIFRFNVSILEIYYTLAFFLHVIQGTISNVILQVEQSVLRQDADYGTYNILDLAMGYIIIYFINFIGLISIFRDDKMSVKPTDSYVELESGVFTVHMTQWESDKTYLIMQRVDDWENKDRDVCILRL